MVEVRPPHGPAAGVAMGQAAAGDVWSGSVARNDYRAALLALGDRLLNTEDPGEMGFVAAQIAGQTLGLCRAGYGRIDAARGVVEVARDWAAPGYANLSGTRRFMDAKAYEDNLARGLPILYADVDRDAPAQSTAIWLAIGVRSVINVPVFEAGILVAVFYVHDGQPRDWSADEVAFLFDLSERTRSAVERRRAETSLRALTDTLERQVAERTADRNRLWLLSTDIMVVARLDRIAIMDVNPALTTTLGWSPAELLGCPLLDLVHPEDAERTRREMDRLALGAAVTGLENRCRHKDGTYRSLSWNAVPGGGLISAVARDYTAERRMAEQLRHAQKMEAIGQLTGGLAHDFNNLLQAIGGSLELGQQRMAQARMAEATTLLVLARQTVDKAAAITHRLLAFARRQTLAPREFRPDRLVADLRDLIERTVGPSVTVEVTAGPDVGTVLCDPNQLENALLNLAINARDAMPEGGSLTIEIAAMALAAAELADFAGRDAGEYVSISVRDSGAGMDEVTRNRAFEPFFTTKPHGQGTGLGLSQVYGFIEQSGGFVTLDSAPGGGTAVRLFLSRHGTAPPDDTHGVPSPPAPEAEGRRCVLLLVEDEADLRVVVAESLRDAGYDVLEAHDGASALAVMGNDAGKIDLLITDVGLPGGMNGRQLAGLARQSAPSLPILLITGYAGGVIEQQLEAGMSVMIKPFPLQGLAASVRALLTK